MIYTCIVLRHLPMFVQGSHAMTTYHNYTKLPRAHAQGVKQSVCMSFSLLDPHVGLAWERTVDVDSGLHATVDLVPTFNANR